MFQSAPHHGLLMEMLFSIGAMKVYLMVIGKVDWSNKFLFSAITSLKRIRSCVVAMHNLAFVMQHMFRGELRKTWDRTVRSVNTRPSDGSLQVHEIVMIDVLLRHGYHSEAVAN